MLNLLVDTNIIVDCLKERQPFYEDACKLVMLGVMKDATLWISNTQVTDAFYLLTDGGRRSRAEEVKRQLLWLLQVVKICTPDGEDLLAALNSTWSDFEDACVYQAALKVKADAIITRNQADFEKSSIRVFSCGELFERLAEEQGVTYDWVSW